MVRTNKEKSIIFPRTLDDVGLEITEKCNLNCTHCWQGGASRTHELSFHKIKNLIDQLSILSVSNVRITGGEPMQHSEFWKVMTELNNHNISIILRTNGTLIDDLVAKRLKEYPLSFIEISIDGSRSETHEGLRRKRGSLDKTLYALRTLLENGISTRVKTVIYKDNVNDLLTTGKLLAKKYSNIEMWSLVELIPLGNTFRYQKSLMPNPYHVVEVMKELGGWIRDNSPSFAITGSALQIVTEQERAINANKSLKCPCDYRHGYMYICSNGDIKKCAWLNDIVGNIDDGIEDAWLTCLKQPAIDTPEECMKCEYFAHGICGFMYYVCPGVICFSERKQFFGALSDCDFLSNKSYSAH